jgi:hypothetical protein
MFEYLKKKFTKPAEPEAPKAPKAAAAPKKSA